MTDLIKISETIAVLERMQTRPSNQLLKNRLVAATALLKDIVIESAEEMAYTIETLHSIDKIASSSNGNIKLNRIKTAREILRFGLKESKIYIEHHFGDNGSGALIDS